MYDNSVKGHIAQAARAQRRTYETKAKQGAIGIALQRYKCFTPFWPLIALKLPQGVPVQPIHRSFQAQAANMRSIEMVKKGEMAVCLSAFLQFKATGQ